MKGVAKLHGRSEYQHSGRKAHQNELQSLRPYSAIQAMIRPLALVGHLTQILISHVRLHAREKSLPMSCARK